MPIETLAYQKGYEDGLKKQFNVSYFKRVLMEILIEDDHFIDKLIKIRVKLEQENNSLEKATKENNSHIDEINELIIFLQDTTQ